MSMFGSIIDGFEGWRPRIGMMELRGDRMKLSSEYWVRRFKVVERRPKHEGLIPNNASPMF
ncbi:hypothetical protein AG1IA_09404 [Rhizoctonia solani AG-1 IA]|uniref:Uncharacterized protein n=1 Tax=Thanatephorus cucumeris (strain AG1-IA) TaxID=983506 RepID=L8WID3_THACA|nr:hypothetical protein AG1IA_09404 [Rhizoctonia solani AG-1 IA]